MSRFAAFQADEIYEVFMNETGVLFLEPGSPKAIGTQNLKGCTGVAIVSPFAAVLAHIPPLPYPTRDASVGIQNVEAKMEEISSLLNAYPSKFPVGKTALVVGACFGGSYALPDHLEKIEQMLQKDGLVAIFQPYIIPWERRPTGAEGTILIDASSGSPVVFVEDQYIACNEVSTPEVGTLPVIDTSPAHTHPTTTSFVNVTL